MWNDGDFNRHSNEERKTEKFVCSTRACDMPFQTGGKKKKKKLEKKLFQD